MNRDFRLKELYVEQRRPAHFTFVNYFEFPHIATNIFGQQVQDNTLVS